MLNPVDAYGELMFGRKLRLRVLLWALDQGATVFNQTQAATGVGYPSSGQVAKELERLVKLGMLRKFGRPLNVGPQNYVQQEHPGWAIVEAARCAVKATDEAGATPGAEPNQSVLRSL